LWNLVEGKEVRWLTGHRTSVDEVAFSADGRRLFSSSRTDTVGDDKHSRTLKGFVCVWDTKTWKLLRQVENPNPRGVIFSPDDKTVAFLERRKGIYLWDLATA